MTSARRGIQRARDPDPAPIQNLPVAHKGKYKHNTNRIQTKYKQNANRIQTEYKQNANKIQTKYKQNENDIST